MPSRTCMRLGLESWAAYEGAAATIVIRIAGIATAVEVLMALHLSWTPERCKAFAARPTRCDSDSLELTAESGGQLRDIIAPNPNCLAFASAIKRLRSATRSQKELLVYRHNPLLCVCKSCVRQPLCATTWKTYVPFRYESSTSLHASEADFAGFGAVGRHHDSFALHLLDHSRRTIVADA